MRAAIVLGLLAGCGSDSYLVVTVDARPAVHDAATLAVTMMNSGTTLTRKLPLGSHTFPVTFSVDAPGRTGELDLSIEADDASGAAVGLGSGTAMVGATTAEVQLETTDLTVNTDYALDQFLTFDYDSDGLQVGATPDASWTVAFRDNCNMSGSCNVFGRKFDSRGVPAHTVAAAGTNAFTLTTTLTDAFTDPTIVTSGTQTLALWNYNMGTDHGVGCRTLDATGDAGAGQLSLSTDSATVVSASTFSNGNIAVVWELGLGLPPNAQIRSVVAKPDCTTQSAVFTMSTIVGTTTGPTSPHVAANGSSALYTWIVDGDVYVRGANNVGQAQGTAETKILTHNATQSAQGVRLVASGSGFALVVRWVGPMDSAPGKIEVYQLSATGAVMGTAALVTDQSRSDFKSGWQSPSVAVRASDGAILVAWHQCDSAGSDGSCDVYGRMVRPNGTTSGQPFVLSANTTGDQTKPAVVALPGPDGAFAAVWTDTSLAAPDTSGSAVRGRIIYPAYDPNGTM